MAAAAKRDSQLKPVAAFDLICVIYILPNYYPMAVGGQIIWLTNFANRLPGLAVTLGLTPAQATAIVADCL